jgi:hypothetical protein
MADDPDIRAALEMLTEAVAAQIAYIQREGAQALEAGRFEQAQEAIARAQALQAAARELQAVGQRIVDGVISSQPPAPAAKPKAPDQVHEKPPVGRVRSKVRGRRTPKHAYRLPILRVLVEAGGFGATGYILDRVYELMQGELNDYDLEDLPSGSMARWRNAAQWTRLDLKKEGLLADDSQGGVWEITGAGRRYLAEQGNEA